MPVSLEEKRARRKARRQARKASQIGGSTSRDQLSSVSGRRIRQHARISEEEYAQKLMTAMDLEVADKGPGTKTWVCFSLPLLQSSYPDPTQAAEVILQRAAELQLDTVVQITVFPAGGLIGIGPVHAVNSRDEE